MSAPVRHCPECGQHIPRRRPDDSPAIVRARAERILARLPVEAPEVTADRLRRLYEATLPLQSTHDADGALLDDAGLTVADLRRLMPGRPESAHAARLLAGVTRTPKEPRP